MPPLHLGARLLVALRQDPEYVVVVERDIPLHITRRVRQQICLHTAQGRLFSRTGVAVPIGITVVDQPATQRAAVYKSRIRVLQQLRADTKRRLAETEVDDISRLRGDRIQSYTRLRTLIPIATAWIAVLALSNRARFFPIHHQLDGQPQILQFFRRHDILED